MENGLYEKAININYTKKEFHEKSFVCRILGSFKDYLVISHFDVFHKLSEAILSEDVEKEERETTRPIFINIRDEEIIYTSIEDALFKLKGSNNTIKKLEGEVNKKEKLKRKEEENLCNLSQKTDSNF
ncbi:MAG: hypothetical protein LBT82_02945 [Oscillospiraceae bacterium]|nr:hypothetical protein [Oscillospiraceae bacterium]